MNRFIICLTAAAAWILSACSEETAPEVPSAKSTLMMDILTDMDMGKYAEALPKIRRYQTLDETNAFLNELEAIAITNDCISRLRPLLDKGDYSGAENLMKELLKNSDARSDRTELSRFVSELKQADALIRKLAVPVNALAMAENADNLKRLSKNLPESQFLLVYAERKLADASALEKLEQDRRYVWCWFDAKDGGRKLADTVAAFIAGSQAKGSKDPMVQDLMNSGMFDVPEKKPDTIETENEHNK